MPRPSPRRLRGSLTLRASHSLRLPTRRLRTSRRLDRTLPKKACYTYSIAGFLVFLGIGAENETRTRGPQLGKLMLYQLSYFRLLFGKDTYLLQSIFFLFVRGRPTTARFGVLL